MFWQANFSPTGSFVNIAASQEANCIRETVLDRKKRTSLLDEVVHETSNPSSLSSEDEDFGHRG
jgi:hypothetical protein